MPQRLLASNFEIARSVAFSRLPPSRWPSRELRSMERPRSWREEERGRERKGKERAVRGEGEKEERWREKETWREKENDEERGGE